MPSDIVMPFVDGNRLHYRQVGDSGPWVVLIQGLGLPGEMWMDQPQRIAALGYRVLVPDNRGFGDSAKVTRPYHLGHVAEDVVAVLDHAGADKAIVAGISLGGMIAQHVASRYPKRVSGLLLIATTPGFPNIPPPRALAMLLASPVLMRSGRGASRVMQLMLARRNWPRAIELFTPWAPLLSQRRADPASFAFQFLAASTHVATKRAIACPTWIIAAEEDAVFPLSAARALHRAIPHAQLRVIGGVGHTVLLEDDSVLVDALRGMQAQLEY